MTPAERDAFLETADDAEVREVRLTASHRKYTHCWYLWTELGGTGAHGPKIELSGENPTSLVTQLGDLISTVTFPRAVTFGWTKRTTLTYRFTVTCGAVALHC